MYWKRQAQEAARIDNWKWIREEETTLLFDLSKDIGEQNNLVETMPKKALEMQRSFEAWLKRMEAAEPRARRGRRESGPVGPSRDLVGCAQQFIQGPIQDSDCVLSPLYQVVAGFQVSFHVIRDR